MRGAYYPKLVMQFYANLHRNENRPDVFASMVKGVDIQVSWSSVAQFLHCPTNGTFLQVWRFHHRRDTIPAKMLMCDPG